MMHIHGSISSVQGGNFYGVSTGERAAMARRAAETRKRLLRAGEEDPDGLSPEETALIGRWMDGNSSESGRDPDLG